MVKTVAYHPWVRALAAGLKRCGVGEGEPVALAVSGGGDSMALLEAMAVLAPRRSWRLRVTVLHVQHGVRAAAEADAHFVSAAAARLGFSFSRCDLPTSASRGGNLEERLRQARYAALGQMARAAGADFVASAHHADDQLETLLLRLARGTGPEGLCAMPWRRPLDAKTPAVALIRPMLASTRSAAQDFLKSCGLPWRHDETNDDPTHARARLRQQVMPELEALHPGAALRAAALADALRERLAAGESAASTAPLTRQEARALSGQALRQRLAALLRAAGVPSASSSALAQWARAAADGRGGARAFDLPGGRQLRVDATGVWVF